MTGKDDHTISYSHLISELRVLGCREKTSKGGNHLFFGKRGLSSLYTYEERQLEDFEKKDYVLSSIRPFKVLCLRVQAF